MHVVVEHRGARHELELQLEDPDACVSELVDPFSASGQDGEGAGVVVDGRYYDRDVGIEELPLYEGATVHLVDERVTPGPPIEHPGPFLALVDGPNAGVLVPLGPHQLTVGRSADCGLRPDDRTMSRRHAGFHVGAGGEVVVTDVGSSNGTYVDGERVSGSVVVRPGQKVHFGSSYAEVLAAAPADKPVALTPAHAGHAGLLPFNRPPRPALPTDDTQLDVPEAPRDSATSRGLGLAMLIGPLLMAGVMMLLYRDPRYAAFAVLSPVMVIGTMITQRRGAKKDKKLSAKEYREAIVALQAGLDEASRRAVTISEELLPDAAEVVRRAVTPSTRLWQRRRGHGDFLKLRGGYGDIPWTPPVHVPRNGPPPEAARVLDAYRVLTRAPVEIDLSGGGVVGLVGDREGALALARSLICQAAVHHGPADLAMTVLASAENAAAWEWTKWLPHVLDEGGGIRLLAGDRTVSDAILEARLAAADRSTGADRSSHPDGGRTWMYVLDDVTLTEGRRAPARLLLRGQAGPACGIVIAESADRLPAVCTTVVTLPTRFGDATLHRPQDNYVVPSFLVCGMGEETAATCAQHLARFEDPELEIPGAGLPQMVRLLPLLGMDEIDVDQVMDAWASGQPDPGPNTPLGMGEDGILHLDLVRDGPHGLIGGTTGSGKSELLRSLVAGMAARVDPEHLVFVLVDYKGGSAFDLCSQLPHTVGMVTDLDAHLGERALKSLNAELHHRERRLREAGVTDLPEYLKAGAPLGPLPRLVVIIDEFATLATELPDFLEALVGVAQRGRSLGVHLLLATQRPSGAVNANIKANTNLRIALRVQDANDSADIIDKPDAASIGRSNPGRAYVRLGPTDIECVQTALSTAAAGSMRSRGVGLAPFRFGPVSGAAGQGTAAGPDGRDGPTDLERLVSTVNAAFEAAGLDRPRRPWLEMLPEKLGLAEVLAAAGTPAGVVPFALSDEPERQHQGPAGWKPADGHLAVFGMVGSGTTTTLLSLAASVAERFSPDKFHLYGLDFGGGGLSSLARLPHTGSVVSATEREAQFRLVRHLRTEMERRRALAPIERQDLPTILVLVDGIGPFLAEHEGVESAEMSDAFRRVFSEGAMVGILFAVAGDRPGSLPVRMAGSVNQRILLRQADPQEFSALGLRPKDVPKFCPGRGYHSERALVIQVADPGDLAEVGERLAKRWGRPTNPAPAIRTLPSQLEEADLDGLGAHVDLGPPLQIPVGMADDDLGPACLTLYDNEHATIAGPPRSGKSSLLAVIARQLAGVVRNPEGEDPRVLPDPVVLGLCADGSPLSKVEGLAAWGDLDFLAGAIGRLLRDGTRRWFLLIDDATQIEDADGALAAVLALRRPGVHVIATGRTDDLRSKFGHWSRPMRSSRTGVLLAPDLSLDGDLFNVRLPRRLPTALVPGRGLLITSGESSLVQFAKPGEGAQQT